jgi:hypothetical protein
MGISSQRWLYTPFIYLTTNGCDPTKCPSHFIPNADNAPLAVLRELYARPLSNKMRDFIILYHVEVIIQL